MFKETEVEVLTFKYTLQDYASLQKAYAPVLAQVFYFIKGMKPRPELRKCGSYLIQYQSILFNLGINLLGYESISIHDYTVTPFEKLMERYNLPIPVETVTAYINVWGPHYWKFLHMTSLLVKTSTQLTTFAVVMLNFNLVVICAECAFNFKAKDPFKIMMNMVLSNDAITSIYTLHNTVNQALGKNLYPFETFLKDYKLEATNKDFIKIIYLQ